MNGFIFTKEPPQHWNGRCVQSGDLFNGARWQSVLGKGFGATTFYGWNEERLTGLTITVFKAGPFRVGYLAFPAGGTVGKGTLDEQIIADLKRSDFPGKIHLIRIPTSFLEDNRVIDLPYELTMETVIEDLQRWRYEGLSHNLKKSIRRAKSSPLAIVDAYELSQGQIIYRLYRETVLRHGGNLRYTEKYFRELISYSLFNDDLRCILALADKEIAGFLIVACHHETAYDLHCCIQQDYKRYATSDMLTYVSIRWAKEQGMRYYNLMSSPANQMSLVRYKEKWGGVTLQNKTYELVLRPVQTRIFKLASSLYQSTGRVIWQRN